MTPMPLDGVRVVDLTQVMAGPFCSQILADLGATVIKVEPLGLGDASRASMGTLLPSGESSAFLAVNRNKKSIALDLKSDVGKEIFHRLAHKADVVLENFRPGVTSRLGVDYETLKTDNDGLIYASISGFGQDGPYRERVGYDLIAQALSGVMSVTGEENGPPVKCGIPIADLSAGLFCTIGVLSALRQRDINGEGQYIDVSLLDSALALSIWETAQFWTDGGVPDRVGSAHRMSAPYQAFRTFDGYLVLGANNERLWQRLCISIERRDLLEDERFNSNVNRMANHKSLAAELEASFMTRGTADWVEVLLEAGLPAAPIKTYAESLRDPHVVHREMILTIQHPKAGEIKTLGTPIKLSATPVKARTPPPMLGQHTEEVLIELGYGVAERESFHNRGIVG